MKRLFILIPMVLLPQVASTGNKIALVYHGPGTCEEDCHEAAADSARSNGLAVRFVGPKETDPSLFVGAVVWIQPGGKSSTASKAMAPELKENIKAFVAGGGGYVGYCAGGFLATQMIANRGIEGLGLIPGTNELYSTPHEVEQISIVWEGKSRDLYWEGGPFFKPGPDAKVQVMATYPNGAIAALRTQYQKGRVYVVGPHPEAPEFWRRLWKIEDSDGVDHDLSESMVRWAAHLE